jgi:hypothetical protein
METQKQNSNVIRFVKVMIGVLIFSMIVSGLAISLKMKSPQKEPVRLNFIHFFKTDYLSIKDTIDLVRATTYNCFVAQTDSTPNHTADGTYIDPVKLRNKEINYVALSRDLIWDEERQQIFSDTTLWRGPFAFGDTITIISEKFPHLEGEWVVHDCMGADYRDSIDFLMDPLNNTPKLGVGEDVKIVFCIGDRRNRNVKLAQ